MIDPIRHVSVFNPDTFEGRIDVIGLGATGSRVLLSLAKLGLEGNLLHGWDFDTVEAHNVANQIFGLEHVGLPKAVAAQQIIHALTGTPVITHNEQVDGSQPLGDVVFLLTDTMASRKEIWERSLRYRFRTRVAIETRLGVEAGRIYTIDPNDPVHVREWESTLCDDEQAEDSVCGARLSVGPTADIVAGYAVWQFMRWHARTRETNADAAESEIIFSLRPHLLMSRHFSSSPDVVPTHS